MKSTLISAGLLVFAVAACQHTAPPAEPTSLADHVAMEQFAIAQVYDSFPTRALVDRVDISQSEDAEHVVRIEMTGSPTARKIYKVYVTPQEDGSFDLREIETVQ